MVNICGIEIDFPFEPYECQKVYMEKVITCIQNGDNGVLESPTGTGKTLCLLCATLAWRETYMAKVQYDYIKSSSKVEKSKFSDNLNSKLSESVRPSDALQMENSGAPKIIYASRTHSQISQVISELKNTRYKPSICVLGSREQMCINSEVQKEENNNGKVHMCRVKVANKQCYYYNNLEISKSNLTPGIRDIEDLVKEGTEKKFCPYYMSREMGKQADITFMPYNYILDFKARSNHSIDLTNSIVILDEGHNVESVCEENMSFDFTSFDLASCVDDCQQCIEVLMQKEEEGFTDGEDFKCELTAEDASLMKALFLQLESVIAQVELDKNECATKHPSFLLDALGKLNINSISRDQIVDTIEQMSSMLAAANPKFIKSKNFALDKFSKILKTIFSKEEESQLSARNTQRFYKVHIQAEKNDKNKQKKLDVWATRSNSSKEKPRTLSYWCFNPGLTMRELVIQGIRSLILTSGTLSPLSSFKQELSIPFNVELENSHVIDGHQVLAAVVTQGPDGRRLNSSYQHRSSPEYQISLGNTVINMARIIPSGLLVFFPSYSVMDMIISKWQACGIWDRLSTNKGLFIEPRRKGALNETMEQYYEKVNDPKLKGALFFAVCRGKVSEGLDFADANGRAVIITGIPFPPSMDPKVMLKRQFLDEQKSADTLSGQDWYRQQASRAVNQAIGRVIRHKSDYGAILLCDERFCIRDAQSHLPVWIKHQLRIYKDFGSAQRDLVIFFKNIRQKMGIADPVVESKRKLDLVYEENEDVNTNGKAKLVKLHEKNLKPDGCGLPKPQVVKPRITNSLATSSLTQLDASSSKKMSLFDSLKEKESVKSNEKCFENSLSSQLLGTKENDFDAVQSKSKKYKIVKRTSTETKAEKLNNKESIQNVSLSVSNCTKTNEGEQLLGGKENNFDTVHSKSKKCQLPKSTSTEINAEKLNSKDRIKNGSLSVNDCNETHEGGPSHQEKVVSKQQTDNNDDVKKKEKIHKATQYLKTLKKELSSEKYGKFAAALNLYKKSKNINVLFIQFQDIYDLCDLRQVTLLKEFMIFVRDDDKMSFKNLYEKLPNCSR